MNWKFVVVLFFTGSLFCLAQSNAPWKKAESLIQAGKTKEAFSILTDLIKKEPNNRLILKLLGDIYCKEGNYRLSTLFYQQTLEKSETADPLLLLSLGESLQKSHHFEEAIEVFNQYLPKAKNKAVVLNFIRQCEKGKELMAQPLEVKISNLGEKINSTSPEVQPFVTADFLQIFYTRINYGLEEIYQSQNHGNWEKSIPLPSPVASEKGERCAGISADGQTLFLIRPERNGDIFISEFKDGQWLKPKAFPHNSPKTESSVCLSSDGKKLYFVSDRLGNKDIFLCRKNGNSWAKPQKLGKNINTAMDEESPWLDADGKYLYFSSKGHETIGGFDIFKVETDTQGGEAQNLGYPINSASDDLFFILLPDEKTAFYSSKRDGGFGEEDIYSIRMAVGRPPQVVLFKGTVSENSGLPVDAQIQITDLSNNQVVAKLKANGETGTFVNLLQSGKSYSVLVEKEGYLFHSDLLNLEDGAQQQELVREIKMQKLIPGVVLTLNNVFFDPGKSSLKKESSPELQRIVTILRKNPGLVVEISSHEEKGGIEEIVQKLTDNRAQAIVDYLVATGIKSTRLISKGFGSSKPLSESFGASSKRIEFKILSIL
jgi:outer membrane protein OmpA-like peptidoglycan-associated protein/tetratricopeptide (TPR) repeat protein